MEPETKLWFLRRWGVRFENWRNLLERGDGSLILVKVAKETYCIMAQCVYSGVTSVRGSWESSYASSILLRSAWPISFSPSRSLFFVFSSANIRDIHVFHFSSESRNPTLSSVISSSAT